MPADSLSSLPKAKAAFVEPTDCLLDRKLGSCRPPVGGLNGLPFDFRLEKTPEAWEQLGTICVLLLPKSETDDLKQIAQSAEVTMMANRVQWTVLESEKIRTRASWCKGRSAEPGPFS